MSIRKDGSVWGSSPTAREVTRYFELEGRNNVMRSKGQELDHLVARLLKVTEELDEAATYPLELDEHAAESKVLPSTEDATAPYTDRITAVQHMARALAEDIQKLGDEVAAEDRTLVPPHER